MIWNWGRQADCIALQTTSPKYPTVKRSDCSAVNGWQSNRLSSKKKTIWQRHTAEWRSFVLASRRLSFSQSLRKLDSLDKQNWNTVSTQFYFRLLCYHQILLKLLASFQRDLFLRGKHLYTDRVRTGEVKKKALMSITVSWKWQLTATSLGAINLRGILITHNWL